MMQNVVLSMVLVAICVTSVHAQNCRPDQFECDNGECILDWWFCDGIVDCEDGSDEPGNIEDCPPCKEDEFQCNTGECIPATWKCDGDNDCKDWSDEPSDPGQCPACLDGEFRCNTGQCIEPTEVCDGLIQCSDGSDEQNEQTGKCPPCPDTAFACANGYCIYKHLICNREDDCFDWSDETEEMCPCADNETRCYKPPSDEPDVPGGCILPGWICDADGIWDCPDGSDEANCTRTS